MTFYDDAGTQGTYRINLRKMHSEPVHGGPRRATHGALMMTGSDLGRVSSGRTGSQAGLICRQPHPTGSSAVGRDGDDPQSTWPGGEIWTARDSFAGTPSWPWAVVATSSGWATGGVNAARTPNATATATKMTRTPSTMSRWDLAPAASRPTDRAPLVEVVRRWRPPTGTTGAGTTGADFARPEPTRENSPSASPRACSCRRGPGSAGDDGNHSPSCSAAPL